MKNILLLLIIALIVASVGAKRDCNCFIRAVRRCGSENSGIACRNRFVARCARRCREKCQGAVSSPNKCNCFLRAVKRCGEQAENAECRKSFVARCARRCRESCKTTTRSFSGRTIVNNRKRCNCFRRAVSRCGYGRSDNAIECRNRFVARCASNCRETCKTTGRNSFRGCSCTRKATTKCSMFSADSRPDCFNFQVNKCKERCARVRSAINSCECFLRSVRACGARADVDSRSCRNDYVRRCSARCTKAKFFNGCQPNEKSTQDFPNPPNDVLPPLEDRIRITTTRTTFRQLENITYVERDGGRRVRRIFDTTGLDITKEFQSSRRICISESGCNCKTVSTRKCLFANNQATCVQKEMTKCQKRCTQTRRCYALSCKNAGKARCNEVVAKSCAAWFPNDVESQNSCIARETQCCLRRERGLCRRARLTFRFRVECDTAIENICGQFRGAAKCQCVNKYRKDCVADKFKSWRRVVRKFFDCEEATALLCQHKRCGAEHELCVARERSVCEPVCERESRISCDHQVNGPCYDEKHRRCTQKYRFEYCEQRSLITCDGENGCTKRETTLCQNELPECFKNVSMCNDNNACTQDFCDPKLGCVNKQLDCDDNNPCTEDRCDANLGCIHTQKVCNDGKICTRDTCDVTTGQCVYQFDRKMDRRCWPSVLCEDVTNCQEWGRLANLTSKCQEPICDQDLGVCKAVPSTKACPEKCRLNCFPYHQCDAARCEFSEEKKDYVCIHSARDCNDNNDCTRDTCDSRAGCRHEMICPNTTICKIDDDCVAYGKSKNVTGRCLEAFCNANRVCDTRPSGKACPTPICALNCFSNNQCETARCIEVANNSSYCAVTPITCDDKKTCTRDTCHPTFGCKFQFVKSENCPVPCANNKDCKQWGIDEKLEEKCQAPVCNFQSGACEAVTVKENCAFIDFPCPDCRSDDPCVDATCVTTPEGNVCRRTEKKCDDGIECTRDFCQNGQCFHEQIDSPKCRSVCEKKDDCAKMYFEKKLYNTCQDVFCNVTLGACQVVDRETPCITREQCLKNCTAPNPCLTPVCERGLTGDFECKFEQKVCNDGKTCTMDFCDVKNGGCTYPFRKNIKENCFEYCVEDKQCAGFAQKFNLAAECKIARCNLTSGSCQAYPGDNAKCNNKKKCEESCFRKDACDNATCVESTPGVFQCQHKPVTCNDNRKCTEDSCDAVRGCRFTYKVSRECPKDRNCTLQSDCDKLSASLKSKCKKAVCNMEFGRCDEVALDKSCVTDEECEKECPHRNPCEFRSCKKVDGKIQCIRQENTCNDNKDCTLDTCDKVTGKCTHTLIESNPKCKNTKVCEKKAECIQWGKEQKLDTCYEPVCDEKLGVCVAKPNGQMCRDCVKHCPQRSACENTLCFMDVNDRPVCEYTPKVCNDNNECTIDTCQPEVGCVYTRDVSKAKCQSPDCKDKVDCDSWAKDQKLGKCEEAYCELSTKKCIKRLINTPQCNPVNNKCVTECVAKHACETAECVVDPVSKDFKCERQPIKCDDKNKCTVDTCDLVKGCKFTYKVDKNAGCTQECKNMLDCAKWGADNKLSVRCQVPACDDKTTSCYATADPNKKCKPIVEECKLMCKPRNACETADCVRKPAPKSNEFTCVYTPITCDDKKECTRDSCHPVRGCQHVFVRSEKCIPCEKTTDCDAWAQEKKLTEKCQIAVCDTKQGTCVRAAGKQTEKCSLCKESADCPPSKYGSLCCEENGQRKCAVHECAIDSDCKSSNPNQWGYCQQTKCANKCIFKDKCVDNAQCDDGDPCTKDVCVKRYGVCRWIRRCVDGSECTQDICIPSSDNKTYQCRNPVKSCTTIPELLNKNLNDLTQQEKDKWLGKCSHLEGCVSCVVNQQCDDNNGCTADSCEKQFCLHRPIHNEWCDPKLSGQPITYQSIPSLRDPAAWFGRRN